MWVINDEHPDKIGQGSINGFPNFDSEMENETTNAPPVPSQPSPETRG